MKCHITKGLQCHVITKGLQCHVTQCHVITKGLQCHVITKGLQCHVITKGLQCHVIMDSDEDYARQWAKREKEDLDTLSEWVKSEVANTD